MLQPISAKKSGVKMLVVAENQHQQRIDNFLITHLKGVPKSRIYRLVRKGEVRVNKGRIRPDYRLQIGDVVRIPPVRISAKKAAINPNLSLVQRLNKCVLYEDQDVLVINKPAGMAVHAGSGIPFGVIEAMRVLRTDLTFLELVHRLDKETSGCLLLAKNRNTLQECHRLLRQNKILKIYHAQVKGHWPQTLNKITLPLRKNSLKSGERMVIVVADGQTAVTTFKVLRYAARTSLLEARLHTGRTHQIRVHAAHAGYPIVGDEKYGDSAFNTLLRKHGVARLLLQAQQISFTRPASNRNITVTLPQDCNWFTNSILSIL